MTEETFPQHHTNYRVVFEDPLDLDGPAKVLVPAPEWMWMAMQGGYLCEVWACIEDREFEEAWQLENPGQTFSWADHGGAKQWDAPRIGPLTEEEAIEYLILKDIPRRVWDDRANAPRFAIVTVDQLPPTREFRNAWRLVA